MTTIYLPELVVEGKRLGRSVRHDPRSLAYTLPETDQSAWQSVEWERHIPILDQGQIGSCTGNALTGALGSGPLYDALVADLKTLPTLDETFAKNVYSDAEILDGGAGLPGEDQGSSGLSVAKVAKADGYISGYQHATSINAAYTALTAGPFLLGCYWYSDMDDPTAEGVVTAAGTIRGGHETVWRQYDASRDLWWGDNSWSTSWGVQGRFAVDTATMTTLLAKTGDVTSLVPLSSPAPTPTPAPTPAGSTVTRTFTSADATALDGWASAKHTGSNAKAAAAWKRGQ